MARKDKRGVVIPAPLQFNNPASASLPRYDDEHRGPAVADAYELSRCRIDLAEHAEAWPAPENPSPTMLQMAQAIPQDQRADWLRKQANLEEADRLIASAMRTGDLPIWVAPIGEPERLVASGAMVEVDHATVVSGCYRPPNDRGWLHGRPLFVKNDDWVRFVAEIQTTKAEKQVAPASRIPVTVDAGQSERISARAAIRALYQCVKIAIPEADPAPWLEVSADAIEMRSEGDEAAYVRKQKTQERTKLLLQRALLSGDLRAQFSDGTDSRDVPGWAWERTERNEHVWFEGRLPLDVFLPDEWQHWSCQPVFFDNAAFTEWMEGQSLHDPAGLPELPRPFDADSKPEPVTKRLPPDTPFVTLSEALSWIAFGVALDRDSLDRATSGHAFDAADPQAAMADAMAKLALRASGGQIAARGKYVESHSTDENNALTAPIDPVRFEDFAQFDILHDGLRYGTGLTWLHEPSALERVFQERGDAFRSVKVNRADLMEHFRRPLEAVPVAISVGELSLPEENFDPSASAEISPWWTALQTIAWVATRSPAFVERVGQLEAHNDREIAQFICSSMVLVYVSRNACICAAKSLDSTSRSESCTCFRDAGRLILEQIRQRQVHPVQINNGVSRTMAFHEFAGVGQRPSGADWHDVKPAPIFSSAEVIAAFQPPTIGKPEKATSAPKRPGPAPDPDWPHAIAKVTQDCIAAGYKRSRKRGDKAAIQTMLLSYMADRDKHFSDDIAAKHAETVIAALPDD